MGGKGVRVAVVGATGTLGTEVLRALAATKLRVRQILPIATETSLGDEIEFRDETYPTTVTSSDAPQLPSLRGLDLAILCAPAHVSREFARAALQAEVSCIDCSGAFSEAPEVPLRVSAFPAEPGAEGQPLCSTPTGAALAWSLVLRPLQEAAGLRRVVGTVLEAASSHGRRAIEALHAESVAIFSQREPPESGVASRPLAFDCFPGFGEPDEDGRISREVSLGASVSRILDTEVALSVTAVQVPSFLGHASSLVIETREPLQAAAADEILSRARGIEMWQEDAEGPSLRAAAGRREVLVGRLRADPSAQNALALWMVADTPALAAANAVDLAVARLHVN